MIFNILQRINNTLTLMIIVFNKYQGAGNDFIIIDNRKDIFNPDDSGLINKLCDRRFGIGADGLILISENLPNDFEMKYFNADGFESTMCGNGGRCSADFAIRTKIAGKKLVFKAIDGLHKAISEDGIIRLQMNDVKYPRIVDGNYFIDTGSPHYVLFKKNLNSFDVNSEGKKIRWSEKFAPVGTNVNFVEIEENSIYVRTFERGVEEETLSCGTGVTASAIASVLSGHIDTNNINVKTKGGYLTVSFNIFGESIHEIWLSGPATFVFEGKIEV
ncbi:MAG: diaminopimelate epimerase [Bacteroidales bacterium]|nr:diaminopimelate epimerase [Bacteroidales bacterium]